VQAEKGTVTEMRAFTTILVLVGLGLLAASPAQAAPCADAVVRDWADGTIAGRYAPHCYGDAIEALPEDVRAYSTAEDDIATALRARIRETRDRTPPPSARSSAGVASAVPLPLVSGATIALVLALAALAHLLARKLKRHRVPHRPTRPIGQW
jgi:hypothetical protein